MRVGHTHPEGAPQAPRTPSWAGKEGEAHRDGAVRRRLLQQHQLLARDQHAGEPQAERVALQAGEAGREEALRAVVAAVEAEVRRLGAEDVGDLEEVEQQLRLPLIAA